MRKYFVYGSVPGLGQPRKVQHVIRAATKDAAVARWLRAHPTGAVLVVKWGGVAV